MSKTVYDYRLENLRNLINKNGSQIAVANIVNTNASYISQILSKNAKRQIGSNFARRIESSFKKPYGWMDLPHDSIDDKKKSKKLEFAKRFNYVLDVAGISPKYKGRQGEIGILFDVSDKGARKWLEGESIPEYDKIIDIVDKFQGYGLTAEWLIYGKGIKPHKRKESEGLVNESNSSPYQPSCNIVGSCFFVDDDWSSVEPMSEAIHIKHMRNQYAIFCMGDGIKPRVKDTDFIIIDPEGDVKPGDEVLVKATDDSIMVKLFLYKDASQVHLMSINEKGVPRSFALDAIETIDPIMAIVKHNYMVKDEPE